MQIIKLQEGETLFFGKADIPESVMTELYRSYSKQVDVNFNHFKKQWTLHAKGYIGQIPLPDQYLLQILPKVPLTNLFRMLEYAYHLKSFSLLDGLVAVESIEDLFENLVSIFAGKVLKRVRKGLYQDYVIREEALSCKKGRLKLEETLRLMARGSIQVECEYEDFTSDLIDNQILLWTLYQLPRFSLRRENVRRATRQAYLALSGTVTLKRMTAGDCINRFYHRLNDDYKPIHALCRFFLDHCGPNLDTGDRTFMPFLVNMPFLFEAFVAEWLKSNCLPGTTIKPQYRVKLEPSGQFYFRIDLVLYDRTTKKALAVMDAKYKREAKPPEEDIKDIVAYAVSANTNRGVLIYPSIHTDNVALSPGGDLRVQALCFDIAKLVDDAGISFLKRLEDHIYS